MPHSETYLKPSWQIFGSVIFSALILYLTSNNFYTRFGLIVISMPSFAFNYFLDLCLSFTYAHKAIYHKGLIIMLLNLVWFLQLATKIYITSTTS